MNYLFDTDHISFVGVGAGPQFTAITRRTAGHPTGSVGYPVVAFHEQTRGAHDAINRAKTPAQVVRGYQLLAGVLKTFAAMPLAPFDLAADAEFVRLRALGVRIGTMDLRIAAIARVRNLIVVTSNTVDFGKVPGLVTEDWTK